MGVNELLGSTYIRRRWHLLTWKATENLLRLHVCATSLKGQNWKRFQVFYGRLRDDNLPTFKSKIPFTKVWIMVQYANKGRIWVDNLQPVNPRWNQGVGNRKRGEGDGCSQERVTCTRVSAWQLFQSFWQSDIWSWMFFLQLTVSSRETCFNWGQHEA